jgi:multiple sugar transport system ATP-binding protein
MAELSLESVCKRFPGGVAAVRDFALEVADGEFVVLVGPSGCGKTTTKDRDIAMVFQDYALYPHMTVRRNLSFALKLRKTPKPEIERRVAETAAMLGIEGLLDRKPGALSGGQQQRVAVGRAVVRSPRCYLFDEPLSNLDARLRLQMRAELKALHLRLKTTTIYVTHDQEEAMTLGDRLVVMYDGEIQQVGPPLAVYREPVNRFVAGFLGSPPMNFLAGRLGGNGRPAFTDAGGVEIPLSAEVSGRLGGAAGRELVAGIRPEQLRPGRGAADHAAFEVSVEVVEPFGDRMDVYGTTAGGQRVIARVDADAPMQPGTRTEVHVDPAAVHLFEPGELGRRL